jgi:hypothetical protein
MARFLAPLSDDFRKQRGDEGAGGPNFNVTLAVQGIQAQPVQQGWRPPKGAQVPDHLLEHDRGNGDQADGEGDD